MAHLQLLTINCVCVWDTITTGMALYVSTHRWYNSLQACLHVCIFQDWSRRKFHSIDSHVYLTYSTHQS